MKRFIRSCIAAAFFASFAAGSLLIGFLLLPMLLLCGGSGWNARRRMRALVRASYRLFVSAASAVRMIRMDVSPEDRARLRSMKGRVVVVNHPTLIDVVVLIAHLGDATSIAKSAAARNPFYARIVKSAFLVNDDPQGVLEEACSLLHAGINLIVFPEGTRTASAAERPLRRGAAQIALAAGVPVQPVRLECDPAVLAKGQPWYDVGDRVITYSLRLMDEIPACSVPPPRHAAAVELTGRIGRALFGGDMEAIP
ncbi:MAG: 1-acyl-sn-glycerol-3-phosphate acyltransferase [Kiritimatiellae bacterium]|nr:1-acyl-sn-glycerol-3-phosphate acyltransferase [Kiritimatiellia bacterium]